MKSTGMLFSGDMVRAILAGKKTQTRRIVKSIPPHPKYDQDGISRCPYGGVGDQIWVRETWAPMCKVADPQCFCEEEMGEGPNHYIEYRADTGNKRPGDWPEPEGGEWQDAPRWRPSIHCPKWASRITLEITDVRVERLQSISEEDALAEGVTLAMNDGMTVVWGDPKNIPDGSGYKLANGFHYLWDSIAKPGADWASNPWCWVIEFKRIDLP